MKDTFHALAAATLVAASWSTMATAAPAGQVPARDAAVMITATSKSPEAVAQFRKGETLFDNLRTEEAAAAFDQALRLDPEFVLARAFHGRATPGPDGLKELDAAAGAAERLPKPERVLIQGIAANRRGDAAKATASFVQLTELAPSDWRGHYLLGQQLLLDQKYTQAVSALKKATELNENAGGAQNMLGYAALRQGDVEGAIAAFEQYVRILPQEPNTQDSLAEALLAAGRFNESEAAFQKALDLSPTFWNGYQGIAYAKLYAGDWAGGREALAKAKAAATRPTDKIAVDDEVAAIAMAQNDPETALAILDTIEKTNGARLADIAFVPLRRAQVLNGAGRPQEALAPIAVVLETAASGKVTPGIARGLRREALLARVTSETQLRDTAAASRTSRELDEAATAAPGDPNAQTAMHHGRGMLAIAKGDTAGARAQFEECSPEDTICKWQGVMAAEKAGDTAGATAAREHLLKQYQRDPVALVVRARLSAPATK